ncbi:hypothetical protein ACH5RR_023678 [Cinchona calisaya]|uniref:Uncharacterized protein n=1 Tax=Cinchona calisaya TaxID=153742 RepID=A0ABD2ZD78_9GENT
MNVIFTCWPNIIMQFEDFQSKWAFKLLQRYRNTYRMFNDDVWGTAGVTIAGRLGAGRAQGRPMIDFPKMKIVVAGAGRKKLRNNVKENVESGIPNTRIQRRFETPPDSSCSKISTRLL